MVRTKCWNILLGLSMTLFCKMRRFQGPKKGHVYCILTCEGQVKRTSLAVGHVQPAWNEEVTFRAVQITSDLQVSSIARISL